MGSRGGKRGCTKNMARPPGGELLSEGRKIAKGVRRSKLKHRGGGVGEKSTCSRWRRRALNDREDGSDNISGKILIRNWKSHRDRLVGLL